MNRNLIFAMTALLVTTGCSKPDSSASPKIEVRSTSTPSRLNVFTDKAIAVHAKQLQAAAKELAAHAPGGGTAQAFGAPVSDDERAGFARHESAVAALNDALKVPGRSQDAALAVAESLSAEEQRAYLLNLSRLRKDDAERRRQATAPTASR